jgi:hypothetical protein
MPVDAVATALAPKPITKTGTPIFFKSVRTWLVRKEQLSFWQPLKLS